MPRAMVIDDSRAIRLILSRTLQKLGFSVQDASNGRQAFELLKRLPDANLPGVILVDWNMPEMNGLEFVKLVRSQPRLSGMLLMMVTTETHVDQMLEALEAGANEYVMKPFTDEVIADKLRLIGALPVPVEMPS